MRSQTSLLLVVVALLASACTPQLQVRDPRPEMRSGTVFMAAQAMAVMPIKFVPAPLPSKPGMSYAFDLNDGFGERTLRCPGSYSLRVALRRLDEKDDRQIVYPPTRDTRGQTSITIDPVRAKGVYPGVQVAYLVDCMIPPPRVATRTP